MREVQASEAKAHFSSLLDEVENGEVISITRHGKPIARIVPEANSRRERVAEVLTALEELRKELPRISLEEFLSSRHEGHRF